MTDYEIRRNFVTIALGEDLPIMVHGKTYKSVSSNMITTNLRNLPRRMVNYRTADGQIHDCSFRDVSFDFAMITDELKARIELYEQERRQAFAATLRKKLQTYTFDTVRENEGNSQALKCCKALTLGQNLFIYGAPGNGKTMLAIATAREASRYYSAAAWSTVDLFAAIKNSFGRNPHQLRPNLESVEFLVLDDLDKVKATDFVYEELYALINNRYENELTTIFTANHSPHATAKKVSGDPDNAYALMSRIASGDVVEVAGNDARVLQARETIRLAA